ncbi:MAG: hypothetical protein J6Z23_01340 [Lachnospiraceae bacterium]|nr:hypothetical protein [Lachnospiraceae bacterium]MBP5254012.1 hypothetical protein [Lachnospiraceae bacterium]
MAEKSKAYFESELSGIAPCTEEENVSLFFASRQGNKDAEARFIEGNLYRVYEAARYFSGTGVPHMDLVQEGSLALLIAFRSLESPSGIGPETDRAIREAMERFAEEETNSAKASSELARRLNLLDEQAAELCEKLDREPTAEELADSMRMDPDDVRYLMRVALSAVKKD